jgi:hypothetical protein
MQRLVFLYKRPHFMPQRDAEPHHSLMRGILILSELFLFGKMDGLSVATSIIAVIQIAGQVTTYLFDVKDAPRECEKCTIELSNSNTLLLLLKARLSESSSQEPWYAKVQALGVKDGPLDQYKGSLEEFLKKVKTPNKMRKLVNTLLWSWIKEEVAGIFATMERLKTLVSTALELDHL